MKSKKALSQIVSSVLLIALTIAVIAIIWGVLQTFVIGKLESTSSCYGILGKISLNNDWTCYDQTNQEMHFSIDRGEIDVESVLISVSTETDSTVRIIKDEFSIVANVTKLGDTSNNVSLPKRESGKTYILENVTEKPTKIAIAPFMGTKQCDVSDTIETIGYC